MTIDQEALRRRFNPEGSLIRRQQDRMTEMLKVLDAICQKHQIKYWICAGTLLGQVRHGGYIPWDDDLDVEMLREDYLRLMEILPAELPDHLALQTPDTDENYFFGYAKLRDLKSHVTEVNRYDRIFKYQGIFIDIFPMEKAPHPLRWISNRSLGFCYKILNDKRFSDEEAARRVRRISRLNRKWVFPVLRFVAHFWPMGEKVTYSYGIPYNDVRRRSYLFPLKRDMFDGIEVSVPQNADPYLHDKFGDYMTLPNLDELHPHADNIEFYDDETSR